MCACPRDPCRALCSWPPAPCRRPLAGACRLAEPPGPGGGRGPRGGGAPALAQLARTTCPRRHSPTQANSWVNFQHLPCFHGARVSPYYTCTSSCTTPTATPPFVLAANMETCSMLNVVWPYMGSGQWTAKVKPRLVACSTSGKVDVLGGGTWFPRALCCAESVAGTSGHRKRYRLHDWKRFRESAPRLRQTTLRSA